MKKWNEGTRYGVGLIVLAAGVALMALGMHQGEAAVVLQKAINICMECIGIG